MTDDSPVEEVMNELEESMPDATVEVKSFHTPMRAVQVGYHHDTDDCSAVLEFTGQVHVGNPTQYLLKCTGCAVGIYTNKDPTALIWIEDRRDAVH